MALSASSKCTRAVANLVMTDSKVVLPSQPQGVLSLPARPCIPSSRLRRSKSRKPVKSSKVSASVQEVTQTEQSLERVVTDVVSKVGEEIATTSEGILDAVEDVIADGPGGMRRVRKSAGKANSRTSRRRALVMCLALGMVRPCASNVASNLQQSNDNLRRTASASIRRTSSSSFQVPSSLVSQVSLATTLKQTNLLGEKEDLQKLTTLQ